MFVLNGKVFFKVQCAYEPLLMMNIYFDLLLNAHLGRLFQILLMEKV